jgi:hypothetical protein
MRRIVLSVLAAAIAAALLAAPADAAKVVTFKGKVDGGGAVKFKVEFRHGKATRAGLFKVSGIDVNCDQGPTKVTYATQNIVNVNNRRFEYQFNFASGTASIKGKLSKSGKKATGSTTYGPSDPGDGTFTNCTSDGTLNWHAD